MSLSRIVAGICLLTNVVGAENSPATIREACPVPKVQLLCNPEAESIRDEICELPEQYCHVYAAEDLKHFNFCAPCSGQCTGTPEQSGECLRICSLYMHRRCLDNLQEKYQLIPRDSPQSRAATSTDTVDNTRNVTDQADSPGCSGCDGWRAVCIMCIVIILVVVIVVVIICVLRCRGNLVISWVSDTQADSSPRAVQGDPTAGAADHQMADLPKTADHSAVSIDMNGAAPDGSATNPVQTDLPNNSPAPSNISNGNIASSGLPSEREGPLLVGNDNLTDGAPSNRADVHQVTKYGVPADDSKSPVTSDTSLTIPKSQQLPESEQTERTDEQPTASENEPLLDPPQLSLTEGPKSTNPVQAEQQKAPSEFAIKK